MPKIPAGFGEKIGGDFNCLGEATVVCKCLLSFFEYRKGYPLIVGCSSIFAKSGKNSTFLTEQ